MINDLTVKDSNNNILVKFADDMTVRAPVKNNYDSAPAEINNIEKWTETNRVSLSGKSTNPLPEPTVVGISNERHGRNFWELHWRMIRLVGIFKLII